MPTENAPLIFRWFDELWNNGNESIIDEMMAPDAVGHGLSAEPLTGRDHFREFYRSFRAAFPSVEVTIDRVMESGDEVAYRGRARFTTPGGKGPHPMEGAGFVRFQDGRIVEGWNYWNFIELLTHAGAVPPDAVTAMLTAAAQE